MKIEKSTCEFLEQLEARRHTMYLDSAGKPTIGIGHLILTTENNLLTATLTNEEIDILLLKDLQSRADCVNGVVKVPLNQNQFDSLVSFVFNEGAGAFINSTLLKKINIKASQPEIESSFLMWNKIKINGVLTVSEGLTNRRKKEINKYFS